MKSQFTRGKKMTGGIESIRELGTVQGKIGELQKLTDTDGNPILSKKYGNELWTLTLFSLIDGEEKKYWADGGLRGALKLSRAKPGMAVEIVATGETKEVEDGEVQVYDIFEMTPA